MQAIVKKIKDFVVNPCLEEEESYAVRSRKLAVIAIAVIVSNALVAGVPSAVFAALYAPNTGAYIAGAGFVQVSITTSIIPYVYLRFTKKLPDWLVDFQIWSAFPTIVFCDLFMHQGSIAILCSLCILLGVVLRVRGWYVFLLLGIFGNVIHALINDFSDYIPVLHENLYERQLLSVRILSLIASNICPLFFFGVGLHMIMIEFVQRSEQADAAIAMNLAVADKLRRYDTDGVAEILAANKGKVDENLLEAFTAIQHNLQEYRPHIPDYVIAATQTTTDGSGAEDEDEDDEGGLRISTSIEEIHSLASDSGSIFKDQDQMSDSKLQLTSSTQELMGAGRGVRRIPTGGGGVGGGGGGGRSSSSRLPPPIFSTDALDNEGESSGSVTSGPNESSASFSNTNQSSLSKHQYNSSPTAISELPSKHRTRRNNSHGSDSLNGKEEKKSRQHFYGRATTVFVRFVSTPCGSDGSGNGFVSKGSAVSAMNILSKCVDAGSKLAKAHGGALQYMQGCGLMVSFNAASRSAAHESKACAFALGLKAAVDDMLDATIVMHASIVTTNVLSFFAGNGGQLMLTVLGGFMPQHTAMHHYLSQTVGKEASCVLLSDTVVPTIEMLYEHRLLGGLQFQRKLPDDAHLHYSPLSQLLLPKSIGGDDEWLYQVAKKRDGDVNQNVSNKVVSDALEGIYTNSLNAEKKGDIEESVHDTVFDKCVTERIADCRQNGSTFYSSMVPPVMW